MVVPLYEQRSNAEWKGLGSASIIAASGRSAIILTARHVLEHLVEEVLRAKPAYPKLSGVSAIIGSASADDRFIAEVQQVQISGLSDIAFAVLAAPEGKQFRSRLAVDPSPVVTGTAIKAVGYTGLPIEHNLDYENEQYRALLNLHYDVREASVIERCDSSRRLKWPVFKVATGFDSTMSGGPIVEIRGNESVIRGVICSDMSIESDLSRGSGVEAWASEIWPLLMMPYELDFEFFEKDGQQIEVTTIVDLFHDGIVMDRGDTKYNLIFEMDGSVNRTSWRGATCEVFTTPWERLPDWPLSA